MISQRIIEVIDCLNREEKQKLKLFLESPYHSNGVSAQKLIALNDEIMAALANQQSHLLEKKRLNKLFFPERPFIEKKKNPIDALASELFKKIKQFLFFEHIQLDDYKAQEYLSLARFYRKNNYEERFWQWIKQFRKFQQEKKRISAWYYLDAFILEQEVAIFKSIFNTYTDDANLMSSHQDLDRFFAAIKLELMAALKYQATLGKISINETMSMGGIVYDNWESIDTIQIPLVKFYAQLINWLEHPPTAIELDAFKRSIEESSHNLSQEVVRNLMAYHRVFAGRLYQSEGKANNWLAKLHILFKTHFDNGYLYVDDKLLPVSLMSLISLAIKTENIAWAKHILKTHGPDRIMGTRYPVEVHQICKAEVLFAAAEYKAASKTLKYLSFDNVNYSILSDVLLLKIYYVTNDELIHSRLRAVEQKVRRSKLTSDNKAAYLNFLKFLSQVIKYQNNRKSNKWKKLSERLRQTLPMIEREWLEKIIK